MFLGLGAKLLLAVLAAGTVAAIVVYVAGTITRAKLREKARENDIKRFIVTAVNKADNVVKVQELDEDGVKGKEMEVHGDDIDDIVDEGDEIYA